MSEQTDPELSRLASRLAALAPAARPPDRDRLLVALGRARGLRAAWPWRAATGLLALLAAGLAWPLTTPPRHVTERVVVFSAGPRSLSTEPGPEREPSAPPADGGYWRLRERALSGGGEALPDRSPAAGPPAGNDPANPWYDLRSLRQSSL
jgi:hypothetical protein